MPKAILEASMKNIYTDDKNRLEAIKWLTTFIKIVEALQVSSDVILRLDVPEVNELYKKEYSEILEDCTPSEIEAIMQIVRQVKSTLHTPKSNEDY